MKVLKNYAPILTQGFGVNGHLGNDIVGKGTSYNVLDTIVSCFKGTIIEVRNNCRGFEGGGSQWRYTNYPSTQTFGTGNSGNIQPYVVAYRWKLISYSD